MKMELAFMDPIRIQTAFLRLTAFLLKIMLTGNTWSNLKLTDSVLPNESPVFLPNVPPTDFVMPGSSP